MIIIPTGYSKSYFGKKADRWGLAGSGVLYYCPADDTILLLERSRRVEDPGVWGIPGGSVKGAEYETDEGEISEYYDDDVEAPEYSQDELQNSAFSEVEEELGHKPEHEQIGESHTTVKGNFPYTTFLVVVNPSQKVSITKNLKLNWESNRAEWFNVNRLPSKIHPGVVSAVQKLILSKKKT